MYSYKTFRPYTIRTSRTIKKTRKVILENELEDIGNRHYSYIAKTGELYKTQYHVINFSCDVLQYLISKGKLSIQPELPISNSLGLYGIHINDSKIPIIYDFQLENIKTPNLTVNIQIKNLFDAVDFLYQSKHLELQAKSYPTIQDKYNDYLKMYREYYNSLFKNQSISLSSSDTDSVKICPYDMIGKIRNVMPIPCSSNYGDISSILDKEPYGQQIINDDFIFGFILSRDILDVVYKYYKSDYVSKIKKTLYLDDSGNIYPKVIIEKVAHEKPNCDYLIIGTDKYGLQQLANSDFSDFDKDGYNAILEDQCEHYEEWLKEYTFQEIVNKYPGLKREDINFGDYITNKKKMAGVDYKYIEDMNNINSTNVDDKYKFLPEADYVKLKDYIKHKSNKMCEGKFNKPNVSLQYIWTILEVEFLTPTKKTIKSVRNAINTVREINSNHTKLFDEIQRLSWTEMLTRNNIIKSDDVALDKDFRQVFTECEFTRDFKLVSKYMHPLNYKTTNYYKENKILTIEELIECSRLTCDGQYPSMKEYNGLPFYAVVPIEITNYSYLLNSHIFFKNINCKMTTVPMINNNTNFRGLNKTLKNNKFRNTKKNNASASSNATQNDSILNRTVILKVNGSELRDEKEKKVYLDNLFVNKNMKVYSNLITPNGLLFTILLDISDSTNKKFYYLVLEVDVINIISKERDGFNLIELKRYNEHDTVRRKNIYGIPVDQSIIRIHLVKEFLPGDSVFTTLGNECIYKSIGHMHDFFTQTPDSPQLKLKYDDTRIDEIPNIYGYMLNSLINMVNSSYDFFNDKIGEDHTTPKIYYKINQKNDKDNDVYLESSDPRITHSILSWDGKKDINGRIDTKRIYNYPPIINNNICISIGKNYIIILNQFHQDKLGTKLKYNSKPQLEHHFKFTAWILHIDYFYECMRLISEYKQNNAVDGIDSQFFPIPEGIKNKVLYHITSLKGKENIIEFNSHVKLISEYIEKYIIKNDSSLCKSYKPFIIINPLSDISSSSLHLHFMQNIIHTNTLKLINTKKEILKNKSSIYDIYTANSYTIEKILNQLKCSNNSLYNAIMPNPYLPALKLTAIIP